jgi:hypothetical protein
LGLSAAETRKGAAHKRSKQRRREITFIGLVEDQKFARRRAVETQ